MKCTQEAYIRDDSEDSANLFLYYAQLDMAVWANIVISHVTHSHPITFITSSLSLSPSPQLLSSLPWCRSHSLYHDTLPWQPPHTTPHHSLHIVLTSATSPHLMGWPISHHNEYGSSTELGVLRGEAVTPQQPWFPRWRGKSLTQLAWARHYRTVVSNVPPGGWNNMVLILVLIVLK